MTLVRDFPPTAALPRLYRTRSTLLSARRHRTPVVHLLIAAAVRRIHFQLLAHIYSNFTCLPAMNPYIHQLLYTNEPPDDATAREVREIISRSKTAIRTLDTTLEGNQQRHHLTGIIERHQSILSPIRRLPTEIICEIFLAVKNVYYDMCIHDLEVRMGPWVLGRICSLWREIALQICRPLWTSLDIALSNPTGHYSEQYSADVLREYLRRSGGQPLDITLLFAYRRSPRDEDLPEMTKFLNIVVEESHRWKSLNLNMSGRMRLPERVLSCLSRARGRLPLLQRMDFGPCQDLSDIDIILNSAPLLSDISTTFALNSERIPWQQLTRYVHEYGHQVADYSWIFRNAPNLVECRIEPTHYRTNSSEHVTLSHLRHLQVGATGPLDLLTAPYLESISVPSCDTHVASFIRRSPCLHTLTITAPILGSDLIPFLGGLKAIETLIALEIEVDDAFLAEFTRPAVLPKLKSLVLECVQSVMASFSLALMFTMVEKRRHGALQSAIITMDKQTQCCEWEERANTLKKDGYIIDFV